ncbi:wings apart-like protein homolog [Physella acuta]|uniref:wings apart-like protein homolog n=1 Tax=Physella acuta TaxID=109671 RepID=UPI0027DDB48D|nr:wings apart-like protein homolog [Physella acuta]
MSEEDAPPPRFAGRTYSRSKQKPANKTIDEAADSKTPLKAAMSISKWGKTNYNYVPLREGTDGSSDAKKVKLEVKAEDPFSFETEDKRKLSPVKKQVPAPQPDVKHSTKLPASRILVSDEVIDISMDEPVVTKQEGKAASFRTYTRTSPKKPIIMDQFIEVGKTEVSATGETFFFTDSKSNLKQEMFTDAQVEVKDEDDELFPVQFKRDPLKTYSGEVVTPIDKPDSPPRRKSNYKRKGGPRGRKPLTVSDPDLIEEYKRNYAAQQLKGKPDTATGGLNNSMVVSKQEMANEDQGTTVVVVCKPKSQLEKNEAKNAAKNAKAKAVASDVSSQDSVGENGSTTSTPVNLESVSYGSVKIVSHLAADSEPSSQSSVSSPSSTATAHKRAAQGGKSLNTDSASSQSFNSPASSDTSTPGQSKRYRIFKSRTPQVEEYLKPPVFKGDEEDEVMEFSVSASEQEAGGTQELSMTDDEKVVYVEIGIESPSLSLESAHVELGVNNEQVDSSGALTTVAAHLQAIQESLDSPNQQGKSNAKTKVDTDLGRGSSKNYADRQQTDCATSDVSTSQDTVSENGEADTSAGSERVVYTTRSSTKIVAANSEGPSAAVKRVSQGAKNLNTDSALSQATADNASGQGKSYRIFKSRKPQVEEYLKPPVFKGDEEDEGMEEETQDSSEDLKLMYVDMEMDLEEIKASQGSSTVVDDNDHTDVKQKDPLAARELLAARLRNLDKGQDSDSTGEPDNLSECSENLQSLESPSNSQTTSESSQKDVTSAPRKFFKSKKSLSNSSDLQRKLLGGSPHKGSPAKATYNARSWYKEHEQEEREESSVKSGSKNVEKEDDIVLIKDSSRGPKLKREVHWPEGQHEEAYTSLRVSKTHKELYTVVHNVKQTHEVQELGEAQDFMDDVDYLLGSLQNTKSISERCLSCLTLAGKCISPAFRMHIRAHGTVTKIFSLLRDACSDPCLALSTSAIMFMLSRDRLNMDLDKDSLNLMLKLNEVDALDKATASTLSHLEKTKQRVQELLAQLQQETHAREIDLGFVSTGNLAMESLLSLTSRRAGEWFKEELRSVGGLDHIVDSVNACEKNLPNDLTKQIQTSLPVLRKLDRCLRVLENISFMNSDNQNYLIAYKNASLLQSCTRTLLLCQQCMPTYALHDNTETNKALKDLPGYTVLVCMLAVLRVLLNVTHEHKLGDLDPASETLLMETILKCLTTTQWCIPVEQRFDMAILCLGLLINMVENRKTNREIMMKMETQVKYTERSQSKTMSAIKAVVELFVQREHAAREMEEDTEGTPETSMADSPNKSGEWKESDSGIQWITNNLKKAKEEEEKLMKNSGTVKDENTEGDEANQSILEDDEETFTKALHKAGKHMENSIVASYAGLLLGTTIIDNMEYAATVKKLIPNEDFGPMVKMLKKFLNFMSLTTAFGSTDVNGITKVIEVLENA